MNAIVDALAWIESFHYVFEMSCSAYVKETWMEMIHGHTSGGGSGAGGGSGGSGGSGGTTTNTTVSTLGN